MTTLTSINNTECWATQAQIDTLDRLKTLQGGGFATIHGYTPTSDYITPPTVNINFISRFSTERLYQRKIAALKGLAFGDLKITDPKLTALTAQEQMSLFHDCLEKAIASMEKTLDGDRSDAHRQAHDTFYAPAAAGVKVHFKTVKVGKDTALVLQDGKPVVDSIMLSIIEVGRKVVKPGVVKTVNSGPKVLMDKCIAAAIKSKVINMKTVSLKADNFTSLTIGGEVFDAQELNKVQEAIV